MSRKVLTAILTGVSLITAAASARADDFACPVAAPAEVKINLARSAEQVETDISLQQLREAAEGHHSGPVLGLYVGTLRYGIEIDDTIRQLARDRFCATPKYVSLTVQHDRAIHIPREFVGDPCLAALARDHEAKHAEADAIAVDHSRSSLLYAILCVAPPSGKRYTLSLVRWAGGAGASNGLHRELISVYTHPWAFSR
jgi:hypothetical protein